MHMQMTRHPRTTSAPLIDPDVHPLRLKRHHRELRRTIHQLPQLSPLLGFIVQKRRTSIPESNKQMPVGIRIPIEQDHPMLCALDDMMLLIKLWSAPVIQQETPARLHPFLGIITGRLLPLR